MKIEKLSLEDPAKQLYGEFLQNKLNELIDAHNEALSHKEEEKEHSPYTEVIDTDTRMKVFGIYTDCNPAGLIAVMALYFFLPILFLILCYGEFIK